MPLDGTRITGQSEIRAFLQKNIGAKDTAQSVSMECSGDMI
jgi:hypothetical protein